MQLQSLLSNYYRLMTAISFIQIGEKQTKANQLHKTQNTHACRCINMKNAYFLIGCPLSLKFEQKHSNVQT
jgi:hypothetical protein